MSNKGDSYLEAHANAHSMHEHLHEHAHRTFADAPNGALWALDKEVRT